MFLDNASHFSYLFEQVANKPSEVFISTFGIYCGITHDGRDTTQWGAKYKLASRDLLEALRPTPAKVKILVGAGTYRSCKGKLACLDCEKTYFQGLIRLVNHADLFPEFQWRVTTELHLKCALFSYGKTVTGVAGGRNFTDSNWSDVTFELASGQIVDLFKHVKDQWKLAKTLDDAAISNILVQQNISEEVITKAIAAGQ